MINVTELAGTIQGMINDALVKAGLITPPAEVVEEVVVPQTPRYVITVNGEVVPATIADDEELEVTITEVAKANPEAVVNVYELNEDFGESEDDFNDCEGCTGCDCTATKTL